jgi:hypothetical protein
VDDIIIGFAERGEMVTGPNRGDDSFTHTGLFGTVGAYQLEVRRASEYGSGQLNILRSFDTNDRLAQDYTLFAPAGSQINPTSTFFISDGIDTVTFEYVNQTVPGAQPLPGNVPIFFSPGDSAAQVAKNIRDTINSQLVQQNLRLDVMAASISTSDRVDLVGETVIVNIIKPGLTIDAVTTDANDLRDMLLSPGVTPVGDAVYVGGQFSAGFFSGGTSSIGIEKGIVLSTGDVRFAEGPNSNDGSSGLSSQLGDPDLDAEFGVVTEDTTILQFDFLLDAGEARNLFFNFVFASEEYNEFVNSIFNDVFAFFVDGQNIALVPGTTDPISINTINGGNPFGTASNNPQFYNNNDPDENGQFLNRFGLDGFTHVFTAVAMDLAPGVHTIKLAISDVGDMILDSAVFLEAGSFGSQAPEQRVRNGITGIQHNEIGDQNRQRDQGQVVIANNKILDAADWGISVTPGPREAGSNASSLGSPRNLEELNRERLAPGVVITNNIVARGGQGGLLFGGDTAGANLPPAAVPFGRIVNNTFYGTGGSDVGVRVEQNAGPTLMNNIVANFGTGISVDAGSQPNTVIASTLFQNNGTNSNVGLGTNFPVVLNPSDPLFVDPANSNFYLMAGSQAIDSSIDSIQERPPLRNVKQSIGIPASNVLSPDRDALGQLRRDDPSFQPPFGAGQVVFKDRGAIDRVDFTGPSAILVTPQDNDAGGLDQNRTDFDVRTSGQVISRFEIKLIDGREPIDPDEGTGIDATTVIPTTVRVDFYAPTDVNLTTPQRLNLGTDYTFAFNSLNDTIVLSDVGGIFPPGFYRILLDNTPLNPANPNDDGVDAIRDLAGNPLKPNRAANDLPRFRAGETGFFIEIPENLDFGDAPESYRTVIRPGTDPMLDGPRHTIRPNFFLGTTVDAELDGQPTPDATGDGADEDGVRIRGVLLQGQSINVGATIALEVLASAPGFLDAWIDFNRNGMFDAAIDLDGDGVIDGTEHVANALQLVSGPNLVNIVVPDVPAALEDVLLGTTFARFRFSSVGGLLPTGPAIDGEVEDYMVVLQRSDSLWQNPSNNLDVNADGIVSVLDALLVVSDLRNNAAQGGGNTHVLYPTLQQAQAHNPPQMFVPPRVKPFVDVDGNGLVTVNDIILIINGIRSQMIGGGEGESLAGEGEAPEMAAVPAAP